MVRRGGRFAARSQRGQIIPIVALSATVLIGASALAVDLGLQTHYRRNLQNVTDSASLAAAYDLGRTPNSTDPVSAAKHAMETVHRSMGWPDSGGGWSAGWSDSKVTCSGAGNQCHLSIGLPGTPLPSPASNFSVSVDVPPATGPHTGVWGYAQVRMSQSTSNGFAGVIGLNSSTEGGGSVAYHSGPPQAFGFALYANTYVTTGNGGEHVTGNVYAGRKVDPQANGHAMFCTDGGGYIILGSPQAPPATSDGQDTVLPTTANYIDDTNNTGNSKCPASASTNPNPGIVLQTTTTPTSCSGNIVQGVTLSGSYSSQEKACVASVGPPAFDPPPMPSSPTYCLTTGLTAGVYQPGIYNCNGAGTSLKVDPTHSQLAPGVYVIAHSPGCNPKSCFDVDFTSGVSANLQGVTIVLTGDATMGVEKGANVVIDPVGTPPVARCNPPASANACSFSIYAGAGSASTIDVLDNGTSLTLYDTLFAPNSTLHADSNSILQIPQGQAIVNQWDVQSGYKPNPDINYDGSHAALQPEVLRLAE